MSKWLNNNQVYPINVCKLCEPYLINHSFTIIVMRLFAVVKKIPSFILIILIMVLTKCPLSQDLSMIVTYRVVYSLGFHFYVIPHEFGVDIPHKP